MKLLRLDKLGWSSGGVTLMFSAAAAPLHLSVGAWEIFDWICGEGQRGIQ